MGTNTRYPQQKNGRPVDPMLTEKVVALANAPDAYLQDKLLPTLFDASSVADGQEHYWSGTIQRVNEGAMFGDPDITTHVGRGVTIPTYEGVGYDPFEFEAQKYAILVKSPKEDRHIIQAGSTPNIDIQLAGALELMKLDREEVLETLLMTTTNWRNSATLGAAAKWDQTTSDPNEDFSDAVYTVAGYGQKANVCVLGRRAAHLLRRNAAFLEFDDMTKDRTILNDERLKEVISSRYGIRHVFIGDVVTKTSGDNQDADLTPVNIWDDDVFIGYFPMSDGGMPESGVTVGSLDSSGALYPMQRMAAGRVVVEGWTVEEAEDFDEHTEKHKMVYIETIFTVLPALGYVIPTVAT